MSEDTIRRQSTGELLRRLVDNLSALVDREVDLAKAEAKVDALRAGSGAVFLVFGLMLFYTCGAALITAATLAVIAAVGGASPTIAALIVAGVFLVLGIVFASIGFLLARIRPLERTRETVREDIQWARRRAS